MRVLLVLVLFVGGGCTVDNPDYIPPWARAIAYPDLAGWAPAQDMAIAPDLTTIPDLLPEYLESVGKPCDGGSPSETDCVSGRVCLMTGRTCVRRSDCCDDGTSVTSCGAGGCCSHGWGGPCRIDEDCCFNPTGPDYPHCKNGVCAR